MLRLRISPQTISLEPGVANADEDTLGKENEQWKFKTVTLKV